MDLQELLTIDAGTGGWLTAVALLLMVGRMLVSLLSRAKGREMRQLPVPLSAKVRRQRLPLALLAVVIVLNVFSGEFLLVMHIGAILAAAVFLALPARCVITDQGIKAGWTPFRRWSEFAGLSVRQGNIRLQPLSGLAKLEVTLPGRFEDADIVGEMRTLIRLGYQGSQQNDAGSSESGEENGNPPLALA